MTDNANRNGVVIDKMSSCSDFVFTLTDRSRI